MKKSLSQVREENEGAFTLVELLVVILIIGILAAIAIPAFLNQRKAAVDSSVQSDVKNAATQVETWMASNNAKAVPDFKVAGATSAKTPDALPAGAPTGAVATVAADINGALADIKVSDGTTIDVTPGAVRGTYTIKGNNAGGNTAATTAGVNYDSTSGGLQK